MMPLDHFALATLFVIALVGTPGPANMTIMATAANYGFRQTLILWTGTIVGFLAVYIVTTTGLMGVLQALPGVWTALRILCLGYILYLAFLIATATPGAKKLDKAPGFIKGLFVHPLNPKAYAMQITGIAQFVTPERYVSDAIVLALIFVFVGGALNLTWGAFGAILGRTTGHAPWLIWVNRIMALLMVVSTAASLFMH